MVNIISTAKRIGFCGNDMQFALNSTNAFVSLGIVAQFAFSPPIVVTGNILSFKFGGKEIIFTVVADIDDSGLQIPNGSNPEQVKICLSKNYLLQRYFTITCVGLVIYLVAKQSGTNFTIIFSTNIEDEFYSQVTAGEDKLLQDNYKTVCDILIENINGSNVFVNIANSLYNIDVNSNNIINPGRILAKYFNDFDFSDYNQSEMKLTSKTVKRYYLKLAEMYKGEVKALTESTILKAVDGTIYDAIYSNEFDYIDYATANKSYLIDPSIAKIETWDDAQQFLYFLNWCTTINIVQKVKIYYTDNTNTTVTKNTVTNVPQMACYIVPCGYNQLSLATVTPAKEAFKYEIWLETSAGALIAKHITYYLVSKPLFGREFWFKNQMGALEPVLCQKQIHTLDVKRNALRSDAGYNTEIDDINDSFECSIGNRTMSDIEHLAELVSSKNIYLIQNTVPKQIAIEAGTYTLSNENEDLYTYKFKYRIMSDKVSTNLLPMIISDGDVYIGVGDVVIGENFSE